MNRKLSIVAAIVALAVVIAVFVPIGEWFVALVTWIETNRAVAWPVFVLTYIVATVAMLPGSILTLAAGFVFGLPIGVALVSLSSVLGACAAFLLGRHLARAWVAARIAQMPRFAALDRAAGRDGFLVVLLVRLSPLFPFNLTNYGLGLSSVRFADYLLASWIGMLPGTVLYVYIGSLALNISELVGGSGTEALGARPWLLGVGFLATLALTIVITRRASAILRRQLDAASATESAAGATSSDPGASAEPAAAKDAAP